MAEGKFIVFEGEDGSGKTTQTRLLFDELLRRGHNNTILTSEPTNNGIGKIIRNNLKEHKSELDPLTLQLVFIADRSQHVYQIINPRLASGNTVICDRYYYSTLAYAYALGLDMKELLRVNEILFPKPSVSIILDVPVDIAIKRLEARSKKTERFENVEFQKKVREGYIKLTKLPQLKQADIKIIDADDSTEKVHKKIMEEISKYIS